MTEHNPRTVNEREREEASNAYVMTLMTVMVGLPFPIINLFACVGYYLMHRSKSSFVKFHSFQAMTSQSLLILMNSAGIFWTVQVVFYDAVLTNRYIGYILTIVLFNLVDYVFNIIAAVKARKGELYSFAFFGTLSKMIFYKDKTVPGDEKAAD